MVNLPTLVHRPQSRSMKDLGPLTPSQGLVHVHQVLGRVAGEGKIPFLFAHHAHAGGELTGEPLQRRGCAINVGKSLAMP